MAKNSLKVTPYFAIYTIEDESFIHFFDTKEELFYDVAKTITFDDIEPVDVSLIRCEGKDCYYAGWTPGNRMIFKKTSDKEVVWDCSYPHWDH